MNPPPNTKLLPRTPPRILFLDALRLFTCLTVITLHCSAKLWNYTEITNIHWLYYTLYNSLVRFSVPCFFMMSGALFLNPRKKISITQLYRKNIPRLVLAFLLASSFYVAVRHLRAGTRPSWKLLAEQIYQGHYHLGFLFSLLGVYLLIPILRQVTKDKSTLEYFLLLSFVFVPLANVLRFYPNSAQYLASWENRAQIFLVLGYPSYFLLGHYLLTNPLEKHRRIVLYFLAGFSQFVTFLGTFFASHSSGTHSEAVFGYYLPTTYLVAMGVFVFFQNLHLPPWLWRLCRNLSPYTFGIYLIHDYFLVLFLERWQWIAWDASGLVKVPVFVLLIFLASLLPVFFLRLIPPLRKILS